MSTLALSICTCWFRVGLCVWALGQFCSHFHAFTNSSPWLHVDIWIGLPLWPMCQFTVCTRVCAILVPLSLWHFSWIWPWFCLIFFVLFLSYFSSYFLDFFLPWKTWYTWHFLLISIRIYVGFFVHFWCGDWSWVWWTCWIPWTLDQFEHV